jgi:hypothetical protein
MFNDGNHSGIVVGAWRVIRAEAGVILAVGVISLVAGWRSADQIAQGFGLAALLILVLVGMSILARRSDPHCIEHQEVRMILHSPSELEGVTQGLGVRQSLQGVILGGLTLGIALVIGLL